MWVRRLSLLGMNLLFAGAVFPADRLPEGPGKKTLESACASCHSLEIVTSKKWSREQWQKVVARMDAGLSKDQAADVIGYLERHFGDKDPGKQLVEEICSFCHGLTRLKGQQYTREQWENVTKGMIFEGAPVTEEEFSLILDYLEKNFGPAPEHKQEK